MATPYPPVPPYPEYSFGFPTQLKRLVDPVDPQDAATKSYVDTQGGGGTTFDFGVIGVNVLNTTQLSLQLLPYDFGVFNPPESPGLESEAVAGIPLRAAVNAPFNQGVVLDLGSF